ncbi:hypothetical protein [Helicobacter pylori]|uniref:hypothetical protein n=1 Tax=Helicobacter pylori TaxID=210 RepID=UPI000EB1BADA|nr:hypothetical protein [Helicobacter pylori]RKV39724.1 hypothetical protein DEE33_04100 [Helicobacter pylori]
MIKEIKVGEGLVLALYPYNRDFTGFECLKARLIPHALKKVLLLDCRGKISPLVRVNYSIIIKF